MQATSKQGRLESPLRHQILDLSVGNKDLATLPLPLLSQLRHTNSSLTDFLRFCKFSKFASF